VERAPTLLDWRNPDQYFAALAQASISLGSFVLTALVARALGPAEFGVFVVLSSVILFVKNLYWSTVTAPLLVSGATAEDLGSAEHRGTLAVLHSVTSALGGVVVFGASAVALRLIGAEVSAGLSGLCAVTAVAVMSQDCVRRLLQARQHHRRALAYDAGCGAIQMLLVAGLAHAGWLHLETAFLAVAGPAACAVAAGYREYAGPWVLRRHDVIAAAAAHWRYGKWLIGTIFLLWVTERIQVFVGASRLDPSAAGGLGVSLTIFGTMRMLFSGIENFATPLGSQMASGGRSADLRRLIRHVYAIGLVAGAVYVLPIMWLAPVVLRFVMGPAYVAFQDVLRWVGVRSLLGVLVMPPAIGLKATRQSREVFRAYLCSAVGVAATVVPMTEWYGASGGAMNLVVGEMILAVVVTHAYRRRLEEAVARRPLPVDA
jgi:O-antigen/teichoic acid export membrane protein